MNWEEITEHIYIFLLNDQLTYNPPSYSQLTFNFFSIWVGGVPLPNPSMVPQLTFTKLHELSAERNLVRKICSLALLTTLSAFLRRLKLFKHSLYFCNFILSKTLNTNFYFVKSLKKMRSLFLFFTKLAKILKIR